MPALRELLKSRQAHPQPDVLQSATPKATPRMKRCFGILFGLANQALFVLTVARLFVFLNGRHAAAATGPLWIDMLLAMQFAAPHSLLLWPPVRQRLRKWIAAE